MHSALGISTHLGWAAVSALLLDGATPRQVRTFRLATADPADAEAVEPYHAAAGYHAGLRARQPEEPEHIVRDALRRQRRYTEIQLGRLLRELRDWPSPVQAALFVGRGRPAASLDRHALPERVTELIDLEAPAAEQLLRGLTPDNGGIWRREQRDCALAAWLAGAAALAAQDSGVSP